MTFSGGTNKNSASLSTNFLISHGHATRSTLTCSRVIHFMQHLPSVLRCRAELRFRSLIGPSSPQTYSGSICVESRTVCDWTSCRCPFDLDGLAVTLERPRFGDSPGSAAGFERGPTSTTALK